ncbi:MAG: FtsW/RodA/SpoVE family cell cycle protein [Clostridia bacterium]|nr:FtsW/RodA/SpoVE family cell cycle protein [Clostridia bacterium]
MKKGSSMSSRRDKIRKKYKYVDSSFILFLVTVFQVITFIPVIFTDGIFYAESAMMAFSYMAFEWLYVAFMQGVAKKVNFEIELIAFFLSGIGLCLTESVARGSMLMQLITVIAGVIVYDVLLWFIKDVKRVMFIRSPLAIFTIVFFVGCFLFIRLTGNEINGAYNWVTLGPVSFQPSEFVKIAFVFVGAATLDKMLTSKNIYMFILFAMGCIGILFLMKDFGTALIFFFTFIVIAFMRSGDIRSIAFICVGAVIGAFLILYFRPHVAARFATYRHIWDDPYGTGYQQTRLLIYAVSGGLQGLGIGNGMLRYVYASTTDLVFGMLCEELGLVIAFTVVTAFAILVIYAVKCSKSAPSTFYSISAAAAASLILFQTCLNIFGVTDILPLTGVTLPFISQGGSSMICCWALFAFIKAADIRAYPNLYKTT